MSLNIYKYEPSDYLELIFDDNKPQYTEEFEKFKEFKMREVAKIDYD